MKIIITVATYWPFSNGVQIVTQYHAEGLIKRGHEITVITSIKEGLKSEEWHNGVRILRVNARNFYYWHLGNKAEYQQLVLKLCENADAIIAVCTQSFSADWLLDILDEIHCKKSYICTGCQALKLKKEILEV